MSVSLNIAKECFILKWLVLREKLYLSLVKHKSCFFPSPPPLCGSIQAESNYVAQQGDHVRYVQNYQSNCVYISFSLYMSPPPTLSVLIVLYRFAFLSLPSLLITSSVCLRLLHVFVPLTVKNSWSWQKLSHSTRLQISTFSEFCNTTLVRYLTGDFSVSAVVV